MEDETKSARTVSAALASRRSVRAFLDRPVDAGLLRKLLEKAARAPSGGNLQPWHIHVVGGSKLDELKRIMRERVREAPGGEHFEYEIYPPKLDSPYRDRRYAMGETMYGSLGLKREDKAARAGWFARNFAFFDAPIALFCYIGRQLGPPQWSDMGMYLQSFMLLLREEGLDSCAQECWSIYPHTVSAFLSAPKEQLLFCGMAIGWREPAHPINQFPVPRAPAEEFLRFHLE